MAIYILGNILPTACSLAGGFVYFFVNKYFVSGWCEFCLVQDVLYLQANNTKIIIKWNAILATSIPQW